MWPFSPKRQPLPPAVSAPVDVSVMKPSVFLIDDPLREAQSCTARMAHWGLEVARLQSEVHAADEKLKETLQRLKEQTSATTAEERARDQYLLGQQRAGGTALGKMLLEAQAMYQTAHRHCALVAVLVEERVSRRTMTLNQARSGD